MLRVNFHFNAISPLFIVLEAPKQQSSPAAQRLTKPWEIIHIPNIPWIFFINWSSKWMPFCMFLSTGVSSADHTRRVSASILRLALSQDFSTATSLQSQFGRTKLFFKHGQVGLLSIWVSAVVWSCHFVIMPLQHLTPLVISSSSRSWWSWDNVPYLSMPSPSSVHGKDTLWGCSRGKMRRPSLSKPVSIWLLPFATDQNAHLMFCPPAPCTALRGWLQRKEVRRQQESATTIQRAYRRFKSKKQERLQQQLQELAYSTPKPSCSHISPIPEESDDAPDMQFYTPLVPTAAVDHFSTPPTSKKLRPFIPRNFSKLSPLFSPIQTTEEDRDSSHFVIDTEVNEHGVTYHISPSPHCRKAERKSVVEAYQAVSAAISASFLRGSRFRMAGAFTGMPYFEAQDGILSRRRMPRVSSFLLYSPTFCCVLSYISLCFLSLYRSRFDFILAQTHWFLMAT